MSRRGPSPAGGGSRRPRIGITASAGGSATPKGRNYTAAVAAAGGEPVWLEPARVLGAQQVDEVLAEIDGLLLTGGKDLDPRYYGEPTLPEADVDIDPQRDAAELILTRAALASEMPILGICRGIQTLNVAAGGSLHQDLGLSGIDVRVHQREAQDVLHPVEVAPESTLHTLLGGAAAEVNSAHHQALKDVAPDLVVTARSADGVIEAVEHRARPFVVAVQWHPERMVDRVPVMRRLFDALVAAARTRA